MTQEITNTAALLSEDEDGYGRADLTATAEETAHKGIQFHVQMHDHTMQDMEELIVDAAARLLVGKHTDARLSKMIEERCIAMLAQKIDARLSTLTTEIIDKPITPTFGDKKPVTIGEFIGLYGREFLTQSVDHDGNPARSDAWNVDRNVSRMQRLVTKALDVKFKTEIEKVTNAGIVAIQAAIRASQEALLAAEKKRVADALAKAVAT